MHYQVAMVKLKQLRAFSKDFYNFQSIASRMLHEDLVTQRVNSLRYPTTSSLLACELSCGFSTPITLGSYNVFTLIPIWGLSR